MHVYIAAALTLLLFSVLTSALVFSFLTRRLTRLVNSVETFVDGSLQSPVVRQESPEKGDEVDYLASTFSDLSATVVEHIARLEKTDLTRRELIANISHDLRTPIASMQGYIDTLLVKFDSLSPQQRRHYLQVASKHTGNPWANW
jgi:signal transduction histidine kinase